MQGPSRFFLFLLMVVMLLGSCKSRKAAMASAPSTPKPPRREYRELSEKLNLDVNNEDNLKLYQFVAEWLGVPHKDGGCDKRGTDCSCFVRMAYDHTYRKTLPRNSAEMYQSSTHIKQGELKEGDLVFFKIKSGKVSHVGIYLKNNWFAHVSSTKGVMVNSLDEAYYQKYYVGAGKVN